jgi:hypothetical protein
MRWILRLMCIRKKHSFRRGTDGACRATYCNYDTLLVSQLMAPTLLLHSSTYPCRHELYESGISSVLPWIINDIQLRADRLSSPTHAIGISAKSTKTPIYSERRQAFGPN